MKHLATRAKRSAKAAARKVIGLSERVVRRLPNGARERIRDAVRSLPDSRLRRSLEQAARQSAESEPRIPGRQFLVPLSAAGSTYSEEEFATLLQYETAYLKRLLFSEQKENTDEPVGSAGAATARDLVTAYLAGFDDLGSVTRHLVFLSSYPREGDEYTNGFVHRRVKHYQSRGVESHVFVIAGAREHEVYDYDGVRVIVGGYDELHELVETTSYTSVSAHFMNEHMWRQIAHFTSRIDFFCFIHGFEARSWIRSLHNYRNSEALEKEVGVTLQRQSMWRRVAAHPNGPKKFIYVSEWWRRASQDDMEMRIPRSRTEIIHNFIDTELFRYVPKSLDQRFKILWIRSANNRNYGSDIAVRVLKLLRETRHWGDISVRVIGDGRHFGEFESAFIDDANVLVERGFISQEEIARVHRDYGVFLVPTRLDTQGVSRDEAMASGLVPVTNAVAAVPEFVDDSCAVIAPAEDARTMAEGIVSLIENPTKFRAMSQAAAERAAQQSGATQTVDREMVMMGLAADAAELRQGRP